MGALAAAQVATRRPATARAVVLEDPARSKAAVDVAHLDGGLDWGEPLAALLAEVRSPVLIARGGIV
jgi:hypothetical protein